MGAAQMGVALNLEMLSSSLLSSSLDAEKFSNENENFF